ncbi:uncharacterized protein EI97DRAFT_347228, partial [Westerdykella ornata]
ESVWRQTSRQRGLKRDTNAVWRALSSWQTVFLLVAKPVVHWLYGLAVSTWFNVGIRISLVQIVYLMVSVLALAVFTTYLANRKPHGPQPCNYGHIQTIVNLVDQWPPLDSPMHWGHSGSVNGIAHAGTSGRPLGKVDM